MIDLLLKTMAGSRLLWELLSLTYITGHSIWYVCIGPPVVSMSEVHRVSFALGRSPLLSLHNWADNEVYHVVSVSPVVTVKRQSSEPCVLQAFGSHG